MSDGLQRPAPSADWLALCTLVAAGLIIARPILTGGYLTYIDNPVHLAEIYSLAFDSHHGWSDGAFCGFPLGHLHSPLWYGALSMAARTGLPLAPIYGAVVVLAYLTPAIALYVVARRRLPVIGAATIALVLLLQRPAFVGLGSALGGMWTFYLASGAFILLLERVSRPATRRDVAVIAVLVAIIGSTHFFAYIPLAMLGLLRLTSAVRHPSREWRGLLLQAAGGTVGMLAAGVYWIPLLLTADHTVIYPQNLPFEAVLLRLLWPVDILSLLFGQHPPLTLGVFLQSIPMVILVVAGIAGVACRRYCRDIVPIYGAIVGGVTFVLVAVVAPAVDATFLGPVSWRFLYVVRVGCALSAIPFVAWALGRWRLDTSRVTIAVTVAATLAATAGWGSALNARVPARDSREMTNVRELWRWLREHRTDSWGRVYVQDTFQTPPLDEQLAESHILALTAHYGDVRQLGATYAVVPYPTATWTLSEFGTLFRRIADTAERRRQIVDLMARTNSTHVVVADPRMAGALRDLPELDFMYKVGRFEVLERHEAPSQWIDVGRPGTTAHVTAFATGRIELEALVATPSNGPSAGPDDRHGDDGDMLVKVAYHPFWRIDGPEPASLRMSDDGLLVIDGLPNGRHHIVLEYAPPRWPLWLAVMGWLGVAGLWIMRRTPGVRG